MFTTSTVIDYHQHRTAAQLRSVHGDRNHEHRRLVAAIEHAEADDAAIGQGLLALTDLATLIEAVERGGCLSPEAILAFDARLGVLADTLTRFIPQRVSS